MSNHPSTAAIIRLLQQEKGKICISIIVPTHPTSPDRRIDPLAVEKAVSIATEYLHIKFPEAETKPLIKSLQELVKTIDYTHNTLGLGLYISAGAQVMVHYPFPVVEKVIISNDFEIRDLLYKESFAIPYYVLLLSEKKLRLFSGLFDHLTEVTDGEFPKVYHEEYLYNKPTKSSTLAGYSHEKGFEKDKSELQEIRCKGFFRSADEQLKQYLTRETPLIVMGVEKELAWYKNISRHESRIIKTFSGNYHQIDQQVVVNKAWNAMLDHIRQKRQDQIRDFNEKIGEHHGISGIQEVWKAAQEGRALDLLVEKDFRCPGFLDKDAYHLHLKPPVAPHQILADAVGELIETVMNKNGRIYFTDNDSLTDFQRVALITRY